MRFISDVPIGLMFENLCPCELWSISSSAIATVQSGTQRVILWCSKVLKLGRTSNPDQPEWNPLNVPATPESGVYRVTCSNEWSE